MLEYNSCTPGHFAIQYIYEYLQTSEACISKTSDLNRDLNTIKFGRVVNNAIVYNISNVWTCSY